MEANDPAEGPDPDYTRLEVIAWPGSFDIKIHFDEPVLEFGGEHVYLYGTGVHRYDLWFGDWTLR